MRRIGLETHPTTERVALNEKEQDVLRDTCSAFFVPRLGSIPFERESVCKETLFWLESREQVLASTEELW